MWTDYLGMFPDPSIVLRQRCARAHWRCGLDGLRWQESGSERCRTIRRCAVLGRCVCGDGGRLYYNVLGMGCVALGADPIRLVRRVRDVTFVECEAQRKTGALGNR